MADVVVQLLRLLHPTDLTVNGVAVAVARSNARLSRVAQTFPSTGPAAACVAHIPQTMALAALAMETLLRWLDATALVDGPRPAALSRQFAAFEDAILANVQAVLNERREGLLEDLLATAAGLTDDHDCPALFAAIARALTEVVAADGGFAPPCVHPAPERIAAPSPTPSVSWSRS